MTVVYSAIFGDYDIPQPVDFPGVPHVLFTDREHNSEWDETLTAGGPPRLESRRYKTLSHGWFGDGWTIYLDGNLRLKRSPQEIITECEAMSDTASVFLFPHNRRQSWLGEARFCQRHKIDDARAIQGRIDRYLAEGCPPGLRLMWGGMIVRRDGCEAFNELWWKEIQLGTPRDRDQISLPCCLWATGTEFAVIEHPIPFYGDMSDYVSRVNHNSASKKY